MLVIYLFYYHVFVYYTVYTSTDLQPTGDIKMQQQHCSATLGLALGLGQRGRTDWAFCDSNL